MRFRVYKALADSFTCLGAFDDKSKAKAALGENSIGYILDDAINMIVYKQGM